MAPVSILGAGNFEQMEMDLQNMFEKIMPKPTQTRRLTIRQARPILLQQEVEGLIDPEKISQAAVSLTEESGIVFIDEIDKVTSDEGSSRGPDVSRQGVQRDLLPIVEGTTVNTKHGPVKTDYILFIAAGAFHRSKPSDLMPELQGRFPIRVEMHDLTRDDFARILREPRASLIRQYQALLSTEGITLEFADAAIEVMADLAFQVNRSTQNIGARRLHTLLERVAGGAQLRCTRSRRETRRHRRSPGPRAARGAHEGRRPQPVHPLMRPADHRGANGSAGNSRSARIAAKSRPRRIGSRSESLRSCAASRKPSATAWRSMARDSLGVVATPAGELFFAQPCWICSGESGIPGIARGERIERRGIAPGCLERATGLLRRLGHPAAGRQLLGQPTADQDKMGPGPRILRISIENPLASARRLEEEFDIDRPSVVGLLLDAGEGCPGMDESQVVVQGLEGTKPLADRVGLVVDGAACG